jgi:hypothetical protein
MESPSKIPNKIDLEKLENSAGSSSFQHTGVHIQNVKRET